MRIATLSLATTLMLAGACGDDDNGGGDPPDASQSGPDGASQIDGAPGIDAFAGPGCAPTYANCAGNYVDRTSDNQVTITFSGNSYSPRCITVSQGTEVTIPAQAGLHPLQAGSCSPEDFVDGTKTTTQAYTLTELGIHGYYCTIHGNNAGAGMAGAIQVVE
jgi:plastocyanin